jgi:hypothetical protein
LGGPMASSTKPEGEPLISIELGDLKDSGDELVSFLASRCGAEVRREGSSLGIYSMRRRVGGVRLVRTYLKKFLHQKGLRREMRVMLKGKVFSFQSLEEGEKEG